VTSEDLPLRGGLDGGTLSAADAIDALVRAARGAPVRSQRLEACRLLGDIAGRAFGAGWEPAERAAFELLALARQADAPQDRRGVVNAMGRGFRNVWLVPFVHRRLSDRDESVVAAAINAAGGLGFPALEEAIAAFLHAGAATSLRLAAIGALGRMGAMSAVDRIVGVLGGDDAREAAAALAALTEMRSAAGAAAAAELLDREPEREVLFAAVRYLASLGSAAVLPALRRLARDDNPDLRLLARSASLAHQAERDHDTGERFLVALTEPDRAVRAALARRLRTRPIAEVLEQADVLVADDAVGVVQVLGELRAPEVTRHLLALAARDDLDLLVRARAIGAIEADLEWEREALGALACSGAPVEVRAAAAQTLGAFAGPGELFDRIGALADAAEAELRGAFLWALQLAVRPGALAGGERGRAAGAVESLLSDPDLATRRRAAYVAGNLGLEELAPALVALVKREARADVRLAALVALAELAAPAVFRELVTIARSEADPGAFAAASRALTAIALADRSLDVAPLAGRLADLFESPEPLLREAAARLAGFAAGRVSTAAIARLAGDAVPAVRAEALTALGRVAEVADALTTPGRAAVPAEGENALCAAFQDPDPALHERATGALLAVGGRRALEHVLEFVAGEGDPESRAAVAPRIAIAPPDVRHFLPRVDAALERIGPNDPVYEPLLALKVELLEAERGGGAVDPAALDAGIAAAFPSFAHMVKLAGFDSLVRSIRTAESLYRGVVGQGDSDLSPPILLWMKVLENYVHAWLGTRLSGLQRDPLPLFAHVDQLVAHAWPAYQRFVGERWTDPVQVGNATVDIPLRALPNALRELQEHRRKRLDSVLSVTEWARLMVFFAVDHPSGVKNLFRLPVKSADQAVRLAHRLHTLAAVRNLVAHRAAASAPTLEAFRRTYYGAFEDLARMA
jgi:HEAT repeat protein